LIQDSDIRGEQRVPYLGRIPVLGALFKTRSRQTDKTNLMVFIRPKILRDGVTTAIETDAKYNYIRDEQRATMRSKTEVLPLLPFNKEPMLPEKAPPPGPTLPIDQGTGLTGKTPAEIALPPDTVPATPPPTPATTPPATPPAEPAPKP